MDMMEAILGRRSVRRYKPVAMPEEHFRQILEAVRQAPSAANRQPWRFVVVSDQERKVRMAQACKGQTWMADAAYIIVGVGLPDVSERWYPVDVAIAMQNLALAAHGLGYGTCWIGAFVPEQVKAICQIPEDADVVACMPLGVPDVDPASRPRHDWDEVFSGEEYGKPLTL